MKDMNEPANFGTNDERPWNWPVDDKPYWSLHCPEGPLDDPAYRTSMYHTSTHLTSCNFANVC
jgi:hypothetical protein